MAPPPFSEFEKSAQDLMKDGFVAGFWRVNCKTKTKLDVELTTSIDSIGEMYSGMNGAVTAKYFCKEYGLDFTEQWSTRNAFLYTVSCKDYLAEGLKIGLQSTYRIKTGDAGGKFKLGYGGENFQFNSECKLSLKPLIHASIALGYEGLLAGFKTSFDVTELALFSHNIALGFSNPDLSVIVGLDKLRTWYGSIFCKPCDGLDLALQVTTNAKDSIHGDIGVKYELGENTAIRGKIDGNMGYWYTLDIKDPKTKTKKKFTRAELSIGLEQKLHEGIKLFLSARTDMTIGAALEFEVE